jgi:hypothetical protein
LIPNWSRGFYRSTPAQSCATFGASDEPSKPGCMNELGTSRCSVHLIFVIDDPILRIPDKFSKKKRIPDRRGGGRLVDKRWKQCAAGRKAGGFAFRSLSALARRRVATYLISSGSITWAAKRAKQRLGLENQAKRRPFVSARRPTMEGRNVPQIWAQRSCLVVSGPAKL